MALSRAPLGLAEHGEAGLAGGGQGEHEPFLDLLARERRAFALPPGLRDLARRFAREVLELLFPHFGPERSTPDRGVAHLHSALRADLSAALRVPGAHLRDPGGVVEGFLAELPAIRAALLLDARAIHEGDPAAHSLDDVILAYPGFLATALYRVAHDLHRRRVPLFPRLLAEVAHRTTGIDINPGARIGPSFAIDHGTGIVIGETAVLGARVKLYQGVTLGAASVSKRLQQTKRHPTIGDDVVIYANATILGGDTVIGRGSRIGGNVWLTRSVSPYSIVTPTARVDRRASAGPSSDDLLEFNI